LAAAGRRTEAAAAASWAEAQERTVVSGRERERGLEAKGEETIGLAAPRQGVAGSWEGKAPWGIRVSRSRQEQLARGAGGAFLQVRGAYGASPSDARRTSSDELFKTTLLCQERHGCTRHEQRRKQTGLLLE